MTKNLEKQIQENGPTQQFLIIPFLSFNEASKIKFVNILSIKEPVFDVTLVGLVSKRMQPCAKILL